MKDSQVTSATAFPTLYHLGKGGALYQWTVWTEGAIIKSSAGQVDGKLIESSRVATPKNTGRANATSAQEQALREAQAMHKHKLTRKYSLTPEDAREEEIAPMLAKKIQDHKKKLTYPLDVQPKLDGARALARWDGNRIILTSRGYQEWDAVEHINEELARVLPPDTVLDGELYCHGVPLQTLVNSWMKKRQPQTANIEYHCYDMPSFKGEDSLPWSERRGNLDEFFALNPGLQKVKHVGTVTVEDYDAIWALHDCYVDGDTHYEGAMARLHSGLYTYGYRSADLLKVKVFDDSEFVVVDVANGKGKFADCAIFTCETADGKRFDVTAPGTLADKQAYLRNADQYIGRLLTVQHYDFTVDGKPWHPVAKVFRPVKDL